MVQPALTIRLALLLAILCFGSVGCGAHLHRNVGTEIDHPVLPGLPHAATALPAECRALEIVVAAPPARAPIDREQSQRFAAALRDALVRTQMFERVDLQGDGKSSSAQLRLEVTPGEYELTDEANSDYTSAVVGYLFVGFWSNWFHESTSRLRCAFGATLRDRQTGREVLRLPPLEGEAEERLSFWERRGGGWEALATVFYVPPMAFDTDREKVEALLAPRALDGPTTAIVEAIARLQLRVIEATYAKTFPVPGLEVEVVRPRPGRVNAFQTIAVRLRGDDLRRLRKVWVGDQVVFDAAKRKIAADERELLLGRPVVDIERTERVIVFAELAGSDTPLAIAEIGVESVRRFIAQR